MAAHKRKRRRNWEKKKKKKDRKVDEISLVLWVFSNVEWIDCFIWIECNWWFEAVNFYRSSTIKIDHRWSLTTKEFLCCFWPQNVEKILNEQNWFRLNSNVSSVGRNDRRHLKRRHESTSSEWVIDSFFISVALIVFVVWLKMPLSDVNESETRSQHQDRNCKQHVLLFLL